MDPKYFLLSCLGLVAAIFVIRMNLHKCKREGYADQVVHGVAGGIAGPVVSRKFVDRDGYGTAGLLR